MPTEEEKEEEKEQKDGEKLALGLVGAGILAAGAAVAVSKMNEKDGNVTVKKNYADLSSDMNSIPIIDIDDSGSSGIINMSEEQPIEVVSADPIEDLVADEVVEEPTKVEEVAPATGGGYSGGHSGGHSGGSGGSSGGSTGGTTQTDPGTSPTGEVVPVTPGDQYDLVVSVEEVESFIDKLKKASSTLEDQWIGIVDEELTKLKDSWAGPDMEKYIAKVEALDPKLEKAVEAIKLLKETYQKALDAYNEQLKKINAKIESEG